MNQTLQRLLATHQAVVGWSDACAAVSADVVEWASRSGAVVRPYPGVIADPAVWLPAPEPCLRWRAAVVAAGPGVALSHTTALAVWRLPVPEEVAVHLLAGPGRRIRLPGIVGHRRAGFAVEPPTVLNRQGLPVTCLEGSIVDAWPLLSDDEQRAPLIRAVGERMTTPARVRLAMPTNLSQRGALVRLLDLLDAGCRSPLEIWGYERVFTGPGFERLRWQVPVRAKGRRYWLDAFDEATLTNFELDGAKYHSSSRSREMDLARDAALATVGIHAVRYSHRRLTHAVREVRAEALAIMAARRPEQWTPIRAQRAS